MASALSQAKTMAKYNNELERANVKLQYDYNKKLADENRDWQERMANSAHQREIADLKAAGLNPVLSVTGGNGAATPTGSSASVSKPNVDMSLPGAIMDMAAAQLNSATQLQIASMNNALEWQKYTTPGANSAYGQYHAFADYIADSSGIDKSVIDVVGAAILSSIGLGRFGKNVSGATKTMKKARDYLKSKRGETPNGVFGKFVNLFKNKRGSKYNSASKKHDMDYMIWSLSRDLATTSTNNRKSYNSYLKYKNKN